MKRILITGGTGSFGRALTAYLLDPPASLVPRSPAEHRPLERVIIYSRDEQKQTELLDAYPDEAQSGRLAAFIGDVRDRARLTQAMHGVDTVVHAAALKIVPKGEWDPSEFIKTNVDGSDNVVHAALAAGVSKVVLLSTDKAVSPVNLYGFTKGCAEKLFIAANNYRSRTGPIFSVVRYGNVACSRGSVIPKFRVGVRKGRIELTNGHATRFWITLDRAVEFVLQALEQMVGGEVFIPRMPSFKVADLVQAVVETMPDRFPTPNVEIIGMRPGEKVHEDLITVHEAPQTHAGDYVYIIVPPGKIPGVPAPLASLTSQNNREWLTVEMLKDRLVGI